MKTKNTFAPARLLAGLAMTAALGMAVAADESLEYFPRTPIDPAKGVEGDMEWSGTLPFWRDDQALAANAKLIGDHHEEWKLNMKFIDHQEDMHPGTLDIDTAEKLLADWGKKHPRFLACLGEGKTDYTGLAATYPKFDAKLGKVMTIESRVQQCAQDELYINLPQGSLTNIRIAYYLKSKSAGMPVKVDISSKPIMESFKRGEDLFFKRAGQFGFSCASCHAPNGLLGKKLRGQTPSTPYGDYASYPAYLSGRGELTSLQQRFRICHVQMRTAPLRPGDPVYRDLEVLYAVMSNGAPIPGTSMR